MGDALKQKWPEGLRYAFPPPNIIQMALGRLVKWGGDLMIITSFCPDESWFPEIIHLVTKPPRHFWPSQWLIWNARTREATQKVMKSIQLTAWRLTSPSVPGMVSEKKLPGKSLTPGQKETNRTTSLSSGVLSTRRGGYQSLKFM